MEDNSTTGLKPDDSCIVRWETDWSNLKRRREEGVDAVAETVLTARKSRHLARKRDISTNRAARILSNNEIDIPDEVVL